MIIELSWCKFECSLGPLLIRRRSLGRGKSVFPGDEAFNSVLEPAKRLFEGIKMISA